VALWWQIPLAVAAGLVALWLTLLAVLWHTRPEQARLDDGLRLLPDMIRMLRRLAADPELPRGVRVRLGLRLAYLLSPIIGTARLSGCRFHCAGPLSFYRRCGLGASDGGTGTSPSTVKALRIARMNSLRSKGCQVSRTSRPSGRRARAMLVNAATGSPKNIDPCRLRARSTLSGEKGWTWASTWRKVAFVSCSSAARRRASAIMREDRSTPAPATARLAASRVVCPLPHPMSSTIVVSAIAAASRNGPR
jgi:hypothetical protein